MPAYKAVVVVVGASLNPTDPHYYFCYCTPCAKSYADITLNKKGKWQTKHVWNKHRVKATKAGRDRGCFPANPPIGHVPRLPPIKVQEDSDAGTGIRHGYSEFGRSRSGTGGLDEDYRMAAEDDNMGGHDEFEWREPDGEDNRGSDEEGLEKDVNSFGNRDIDLSDPEQEFGDDGISVEEATDEDADDEEDADEEETEEEESESEPESVAASESDSGYPEADEGALRNDGDLPLGFVDETRDIEGEAEDEAAQFDHHRPHPSDEKEVVEPDVQVDEDEALAGMLAEVQLNRMARAREESPEGSPQPDLDFNDFGGGGVDFDRDQDGDEGDYGDGFADEPGQDEFRAG
ncbi:hypothetical protein P7C70_g8929, partial [Phenoliferia sp. Uapishka_3]